MKIKYYSVISSTGKIHLATKFGSRFQTICNSSNGPSYFDDMLKNWPTTNKGITCKNCLKIIYEEMVYE